MKLDADEPNTQPGSGLCGTLAQLHDERIRLMSLVAHTYRHLADNLGRELELAVGIPPIFFDVLVHVTAAPGGRLTMSRLSEQVAVTTGGMTRLVDRMVGAGLVLRENSSKDRRRIHVVLTGAGQAVLERAIAAHIESIDHHLVAPLNDNDHAALAMALSTILGQQPFSDDVLYIR
jgi:DNA-binding MarR family transcriptional regulator